MGVSGSEFKDHLFQRWRRSLQSFNSCSTNNCSTAIEKAFEQLTIAHSSPGRYYHTLEHVDHVLSVIQILHKQAHSLAAVELAAWFHDVVYDSRAQDNELKSADYAESVLRSLSAPTEIITTIQHLVLQTKHHNATDDPDSQILLDADLAILGSPPAQYQRYASAIRQEYLWMTETQYKTGRIKVLKRFLEREKIYFTPQMQAIAESAARFNLATEIEELERSDGN